MVIGVLSAMMATKVDEGKEDLGIFHRIFLAVARSTHSCFRALSGFHLEDKRLSDDRLKLSCDDRVAMTTTKRKTRLERREKRFLSFEPAPEQSREQSKDALRRLQYATITQLLDSVNRICRKQ
jgi:hypothetical protein